MNYQVNVEDKIKESGKNLITVTQLRLLLSNTSIVKNKIEMEKNEKGRNGYEISEDIKNDIKYLLIRHIYQCGREDKVFRFDKNFKISEGIRSIKSEKDFFIFYRYLEEIVAYMKYYEQLHEIEKNQYRSNDSQKNRNHNRR
ncbi:MAG: type III-A CRISPR-associated protein Csm2 [Peptostreptococcaceae bacterium]|nr:type III-A CRISPR-associated protein Csm2 [Peptostreptococcaceae bacterium]